MTLRNIITPEGIEFSLVVNGKTIPVSDWGNHANLAAELIIGWLSKDVGFGIKNNAESLFIDKNKASEISDEHGKILGLPPIEKDIILHIENEGIITQPNFRFSHKFMKNHYQPFIGASRCGAFLKMGTTAIYKKLPKEVYEILEAIDEINKLMPSDTQGKLECFAKIQDYLPEETKNSIKLTGALRSTKVYFANAFKIKVIPDSSRGFNFYPQLCKFSEETNYDLSLEPIKRFDDLLTAADNEKFYESFSRAGINSNYILGNGCFLILSNDLKKALTHIKEVHSSDDNNLRRQFLQNPQAYLSECMFDGIPDDEILNSIFSDRIEGFGEKRKPIIPWIKITGQEWFPNDDSPSGIKIECDGQTNYLTLTSEELEKLAPLLREGKTKGLSEIKFKDHQIPTDNDSISAVESLITAKPNSKLSQEPSKDKDSNPSYVLYVKENFDEISYKISSSKRKVADFSLPKSLITTLKTHQQHGVNWLYRNYANGRRGALLADDMGLGKTLQSFTFIMWLREQMEMGAIARKPILIVAPVGLLKNWEKEHELHFRSPGMGDILKAFGPDLKKIRKKSKKTYLPTLDEKFLNKADWVLTTYETLSNYETSFASINFAAVVFDEIQKVKSPDTKVTQSAKTINADFKIGMTGTPVENRLADLWCIYDNLLPGFLGSLKEFSNKYEEDQTEEKLELLYNQISCDEESNPSSFLRRMKEGVLDGLPKKHILIKEVTMPEHQCAAYDLITGAVRNSDERKKGMEALHKLRSISLHPTDYKQDEDEKYIAQSARLIATFEILDNVYKQQEKALIFIEYRSWNSPNYLPLLIKKRYNLKTSPMVINGEISGPERQAAVDKFQEDGGFDVMLVSPKAGGVGITLTKANHVIHLSRWWNPAVEDQCTDRAYRMGQKKDVYVYYPMARHPSLGDKSFDLVLNKMLERKRDTSNSLLAPQNIMKNEEDLLKSLFSGNETGLTLNDIDLFTGIQFESWIKSELVKHGLIVQYTPGSGDGGADLVVKNKEGIISAIIQCKHIALDCIGDKAVKEVMRAKNRYNCQNPQLFVISNAHRYSYECTKIAQENNVFLISRDNLLRLVDYFNPCE